MKANEAPEKLYFSPNSFEVGEAFISILTSKSKGDIEYTRTDAFIEKIEEYIYKQLNEGCIECGDIVMFIENMKKSMKG